MKELIILDNGDKVKQTIGPHYFISQTGNLYSAFKDKRSKMPIAKDCDGNEYRLKKVRIIKGYAVAKMSIEVNKEKVMFVHRLVAWAFCHQYTGNDQVNHKDFNRSNNHYTNLEWCTAKENTRHAILNGRIGMPKVIHVDPPKLIGMRHKEAMMKYGLTYNQVSYLKRIESRGYKIAGGG